DSEDQRGDRARVDAVGEAVASVNFEEVGDAQAGAPQDPIVADQDAAHCAQQGGVGDQPVEDVAVRVLDQLPGHDQDANDGSDHSAGAEADQARVEVGEVVGGGDDVGGDVGSEGGDADGEHGNHQ